MRPKIYLAGPEVFFADPDAEAGRLKDKCAANGLEGRFPTDGDKPPVGDGMTLAAAIYHGNVDLIRACDGVIANMMPFRGVSMDVGTAFEIGYAVALDKPVFGWSPAHDRTYRARSAELQVDDGMSVEDFDITDNLMVVIPLHGGRVHASFDAAVAAAGEHFAGREG